MPVCPSGFYQSNNMCLECQPPCHTCTNTTSCTSCTLSAGIIVYLDENTCVVACPAGKYPKFSSLSNTCESCSAGCLTCFQSGLQYCTSCTNVSTTVYYLTGTTCSTSCPLGSYPSANQCIRCPTECYNCTSTSCDRCNVGYTKQSNGSCTAECPAGQYNNSTSCVSCDAACQRCYGPLKTTCYTCKNNGTTNFFKSSTSNVCSSSCLSG